jgi:hypothetical protein
MNDKSDASGALNIGKMFGEPRNQYVRDAGKKTPNSRQD